MDLSEASEHVETLAENQVDHASIDVSEIGPIPKSDSDLILISTDSTGRYQLFPWEQHHPSQLNNYEQL